MKAMYIANFFCGPCGQHAPQKNCSEERLTNHQKNGLASKNPLDSQNPFVKQNDRWMIFCSKSLLFGETWSVWCFASWRKPINIICIVRFCLAGITSKAHADNEKKKQGLGWKHHWLWQLYLPQIHHVYLDCFQEKTEREGGWKHMLAAAAIPASNPPVYLDCLQGKNKKGERVKSSVGCGNYAGLKPTISCLFAAWGVWCRKAHVKYTDMQHECTYNTSDRLNDAS